MRVLLTVAIVLTLASISLEAEPASSTTAPWPSLRIHPWRDGLQNWSRLSSAELRYHFERHEQRIIAEKIDRDGDSIVDGMTMDVDEFIARMEIILSSQRPFEYKTDIYGNPTDSPTALGPTAEAL